MEPREYIESGILEQYVYGLLDDAQNQEVAKMAREHAVVRDEIISIEKAVVALSTSFSPHLSAENFEKIKRRLEPRHTDTPIIETHRRNNWAAWTGWIAAILFLAGAGYLYMLLNHASAEAVNADVQSNKLQDSINILSIRNKTTDSVLAVVRDDRNTIVRLTGQTTAPGATAKVYWNRETQAVYLDASGLPEPPEGQVYQVWALKLRPQLQPTSIGLLANFDASSQEIVSLNDTADADAFGITVALAGGSETPVFEQMYVFGRIDN